MAAQFSKSNLYSQQGLKNAFILGYTSKNLGIRICTDILFLNGFPLTIFFFFPLGNATFAIFAKDVPMIPIKHI